MALIREWGDELPSDEDSRRASSRTEGLVATSVGVRACLASARVVGVGTRPVNDVVPHAATEPCSS